MTDQPEPESVVIERLLDAPTPRVWELWTDPDHFASWYGPNGATVTVISMDLRVGGRRLIRMAMDTPGGPMQMWFTGEHLEVVANERLVYTEAVCDEGGTVLAPSAMGMPDDYPTTTEVVIDLEPVGAQTRMTITHRGVAADSPGAAGWTMAIDKLAASIAAR